MSVLADPIVDWGELLQIVWTSLVGGVGVTATFALGLYGAIKTMETRQGGQGVIAVGYAAMTVAAMAVVVLAIVFAVATITTK